MEFLVRVSPDSISKVGQTPSLADLQTHRIKKYRKLLGDEKWKELSRAIGLKAHGVGIGSFVYIRRVFEHLIERARKEAAKDENWDGERFLSVRMVDKIKMLKDRLPEFLAKNHRIYSVLGKGIHELTEEECLKMFDPIETGIELILDEELTRAEKERKIQEAQKALDNLTIPNQN